jgi:spore coat protein U-like protein
MRSNILAPVAAGVFLAMAGVAEAANKQTTMTVSATVLANCIVSAENLDFGSYDSSGPLQSSADITVRCSKDSPYTLSLSPGGGSYAQRLLANGTDTLEYNLYTTGALSAIWGDGTSTTSTVAGTGLGMSSSNDILHTIYGELPNSDANQDAPVGTYTDTITVTIDY